MLKRVKLVDFGPKTQDFWKKKFYSLESIRKNMYFEAKNGKDSM